MKARDLRGLLERMCEAVPAAASEIGYERRTCILHARVACDFLRERGVRARPLACKVMIGNRAWCELMVELGHLPVPHEWRDRGEWALGVGYGQDPRADRPGYDGHVVTVVEERYVLDLTLDQASRPQRQINLQPVVFEATREFLRGEKALASQVNDAWVRYEAMPADRAFLLAPDWVMPPGAGRLSPLPRVRAALA